MCFCWAPNRFTASAPLEAKAQLLSAAFLHGQPAGPPAGRNSHHAVGRRARAKARAGALAARAVFFSA